MPQHPRFGDRVVHIVDRDMSLAGVAQRLAGRVVRVGADEVRLDDFADEVAAVVVVEDVAALHCVGPGEREALAVGLTVGKAGEEPMDPCIPPHDDVGVCCCRCRHHTRGQQRNSADEQLLHRFSPFN